jgi:hypothetical protein
VPGMAQSLRGESPRAGREFILSKTEGRIRRQEEEQEAAQQKNEREDYPSVHFAMRGSSPLGVLRRLLDSGAILGGIAPHRIGSSAQHPLVDPKPVLPHDFFNLWFRITAFDEGFGNRR